MLTLTPEDPAAPDCVALMDELNDALAAITGERRKPSFEPEHVRVPNARFVVARDAAGRALGCGAFRPYRDGVAEIRRVYARPGTRGVGSAIMAYLEDEARRIGYHTLWLETRQVNRHAIAFYERRGFRRIPNYGKYVGIATAADRLMLSYRLDSASPANTAPDTMAGKILCARDGAIATVTLSNPGKLNAVDFSMWQSLAAAFTALSADASVRCVILRGEGDQAFAAGGDIEEFLVRRDTVENAMLYHAQVSAALRSIADCRHPTIALIGGACIGGGLEIAAQCDMRICGASARFGAPINKLGFSMYPGEMENLLRLAGEAVLSEILLEGRIFDAAEAHAKGLVTRVMPDHQAEEEAYASARRICAGAPLVASWHKQWIRRLRHDLPLTEDELRASFAFLATEDYREGLAAFLAKRKPEFKAR